MGVDITACGKPVDDDQVAKCPPSADSHLHTADSPPLRHFRAPVDGLAEALGAPLGVMVTGAAERIAFSRFLALSSVPLRSSDWPFRNTVGVPVTLRVFSA